MYINNDPKVSNNNINDLKVYNNNNNDLKVYNNINDLKVYNNNWSKTILVLDKLPPPATFW